MSSELLRYGSLLTEIKARIRKAQGAAALSVNAEMIAMYWDVGRMILRRQSEEGWGTGVIPRLAADLRNELPDVKGFSERNIGYMVRFAREYEELSILQPVVAKSGGVEVGLDESAPILSQPADARALLFLQQTVAKIPWSHNILLIEKVKEPSVRLWYVRQTIEHGWSRDFLAKMVQGGAHERHGAMVNNFHSRLPAAQSSLAIGLLKDPYLFDFLTIEERFMKGNWRSVLSDIWSNFFLNWGLALPL